MKKQDYEKLNDLACGLERLTINIELAEHMASDLVQGTVQGNVVDYIERLWSLLAALVEISHLRESDLDMLLKSVSVDKPSGQTAQD